jgi:hypothetical protein
MVGTDDIDGPQRTARRDAALITRPATALPPIVEDPAHR